MSEAQNTKDGQKTVVTFIAGLIIGGLLVWVFSGDDARAPKQNDDEQNDVAAEVTEGESIDVAVENVEVSTPTLQTGDGAVAVSDQAASSVVSIDSATFPSDEGWIGVRDYQDGELGFVLGVARFSKEQGLIPEDIQLLTPTVAGKTYAVVFYSESGDRTFDLRNDVMVEGVMSTFTAN